MKSLGDSGSNDRDFLLLVIFSIESYYMVLYALKKIKFTLEMFVLPYLLFGVVNP